MISLMRCLHYFNIYMIFTGKDDKMIGVHSKTVTFYVLLKLIRQIHGRFRSQIGLSFIRSSSGVQLVKNVYLNLLG